MLHSSEDPVREFLNSVRYARVEYNRLGARIKQLEAQCMSITSSLSASAGGGNADTERMWAALADESARLYPQLRAAQELEREVEEFIRKLPNAGHRAILRLRYLDGLSWPKVSMQLSHSGLYYSDRQLFRLHGEALNAARELWAEEHKEDKS